MTPPAGRSAPSERAINIPTALLAWMALLAAIHAGRTWLDDVDDTRLVLELAFLPASWSVGWGLAEAGEVVEAARRAGGDPDALEFRLAWARYVAGQAGDRPWTWLSYALLHGSWTHLALNAVWLAAFGTPVVRRAGAWRSLALAAIAAVGGALAQWLSDPLAVQPMIGLSASVSGFMGAAATFVFGSRQDPPGLARPSAPRRPDWSYLRRRNVLLFIAMWLLANALFGFVAVPLGIADGAGIAWQAHIGGLLAGLAVFPLLDPGPGRAAAGDA